MNRKFFVLGFFGFAALATTALAQEVVHQGYVSKVTDGDTLHFKTGRNYSDDLTIRMVGIDAPESHFPVPGHGMVGQGEWGNQATAYMAKLVPVGTRARLVDYGTDKYGRTLGRVIVPQGDVNLQMVVAGAAVPYALCTGEDCDENFIQRQQTTVYAQACEDALKAGRGIFNRKNPLKELPYEFRRRMAGRPKMDYYVGDLRTHALYNPLDYKKVPVCQRIFFITTRDAKNAGFH